jgi:hypothetical protein
MLLDGMLGVSSRRVGTLDGMLSWWCVGQEAPCEQSGGWCGVGWHARFEQSAGWHVG